MNCERCVERSLNKMRDCNRIYGSMIFQKIGFVSEVDGLETKEHFRQPPTEGYRTYKQGTVWGGAEQNLWLHMTFTIPEEARGQKVFLTAHTGAKETLCFINRCPIGLLNDKNDFVGGKHAAIFICDNAKPGDTFDVAFESYAGHFCPGDSPYSQYGVDTDLDAHKHTFDGISICVMDDIIKDFYYDFQVVIQMAKFLPLDNYQQKLAHECIDRAFPHLIMYPADGYSMEEIHESVRKADLELQPALEKGKAEHTRGHVGLLGHSHMDTAWLWPMKETIRKCARTYSQVLTLMDLYPDYHFIQSSALHSEWMRQYYPSLFEKMKKYVAEGRYEPNGGVWVECDCNISGGEYIIRQFLYGQRFTMKHFGYRSDIFWLPDTFGYNPAIPQIMKQCGVDYFCTTKMDWNDVTDFPFDTFRWRGSDGTEVLCHLFKSEGLPDAETILGVAKSIPEKRSSEARLFTFGFGDGGGGPTYGAIEFAERCCDVAGMPDAYMTTASHFMHQLETYNPDLPVYDSELYLEFHRGTLTTMAQTKRNNRIAEIAVHQMECLNVIGNRPRLAKTDDYLKLLLQNQFHDILPGTGIESVNAQCRKEMEALISDVSSEIQTLTASMTDGDSSVLTLFNMAPVPFASSDIVTLNGKVALAKTEGVSYQDILGNTKTDLTGITVDALGATSMKRSARLARKASAFKAEGRKLETPFYSVEFDEDGYIASLWDKRVGKQVRRPGGNPLGTFYFGENLPVQYDNWEIEWDEYKKQKPITGALLKQEVVLDSHVEYRIRNYYRLSAKSEFVVDTVFYASNPRIDYHLVVDWNERHRLFKVGFDVAVKTPYVRNETQFGYIERPTTRNTPEEFAKFEVCNHKWSDLSEPRYGVAVLNDCKYGIGVEGSDMRLTLHRGGIRPDTTGDRGVHEMRFALLPHIGGFTAESVCAPAYRFNHWLIPASGATAYKAPFASVNVPNVYIETIKTAEDRPKDGFVLRLYECERSYTEFTLNLPENVAHVYRTNMLEEIQEELPVNGDATVNLSMHPFEILTLLIVKK